jgi:hypothetical protein
MLTIPTNMGVNATKEHQAVISKLIYGLMGLFTNGEMSLFPYPETMINEAETSPTPDILLFDHAVNKTVVIIEINHPDGLKKDTRNLKELIEEYELAEGFLYDYKTKRWWKYKKGVEITENPSFCEAIQYNLNDFLV